MELQNLGLLDLMTLIINEERGTSDYAITEYLLLNIDRMDDVSIYNIMDDVYVSRSSVRRYCQRLGYENFSALKSSINAIIFPSNIHLRKFIGAEAYRRKLASDISDVFNDINSIASRKIITDISEKIHCHEDVLIFAANNTSSNLTKFQQELMYAKKIIKIINVNRYNDCAEMTQKSNPLIIVVSVSGAYSEAMQKLIQEMRGKKILITANRNPEILAHYNEIVFLSSKDVRSDELGLIGKYGVTYLFDLVSEDYIYHYS